MDAGVEFALTISAVIFIVGFILMLAEAPFKWARKNVDDFPQPARFGCSMLGILIETIVVASIGIVMLVVAMSIMR